MSKKQVLIFIIFIFSVYLTILKIVRNEELLYCGNHDSSPQLYLNLIPGWDEGKFNFSVGYKTYLSSTSAIDKFSNDEWVKNSELFSIITAYDSHSQDALYFKGFDRKGKIQEYRFKRDDSNLLATVKIMKNPHASVVWRDVSRKTCLWWFLP